jgi:tetratricopeptide (TPR) repeat protein
MSNFSDTASSDTKIDELQPAGHGVGDRQQYYSKWDDFAAKTNASLTEEEEEAKRCADAVKFKDPVSEAQKKDIDKRKLLVEAKKQWDGITQSEESMKAVISNEKLIADRVISADDMGSKQVLVLKNNSDCSYDIPSDTKLIKFFIEHCQRCTFRLHCSLKTSFVEIAHCEDVTLVVSTHPAHTVQVDISKNIKVYYHRDTFTKDSKLYHSSVNGLSIEYDILGTGTDTKSQELDDFALAAYNTHIAPKDQQFVTVFLDNELTTDLVLRDARGHPTTQREVDLRHREVEEEARKRGISLEDPAVQSALHEYDAVSPQQLGKKYKDDGNAAFKACDYGQAAVFYTQAIEAVSILIGEKDEATKDLLTACFSNRSACALKLGEHENALSDAQACLDISPDHIKATFRLGLALHALKRYREACPVLGKALKLKPGDKEISAALLFAERRASSQGSNV